MKTRILAATIIVIVTINPFSHRLQAQEFETPVDYLEYLSEQYSGITENAWSYLSTMAHSRNARKMEKKRQQLLETLKESKKIISDMPPYNEDGAFRDTVLTFLDIYYNIMNEDYAKIVDMEAIAEQSYDLMEAYIMAQDLASEKLEAASDMMVEQQQLFAEKNNITLIDEENELNDKMEKAGHVMDYYHDLYLIFFKSYKQEAYLVEAMSNNDVNALQQNKNALSGYSNEGLQKLKDIKSLEGDNSLKVACGKMLDFYQEEADEKVPVMIDYYLTLENFEKIKSAFDAKRESKRTQEDIDQYNKGVEDVNKAAETYNKINDALNEERGKLLDQWNNTVQDFLDKHVPN